MNWSIAGKYTYCRLALLASIVLRSKEYAYAQSVDSAPLVELAGDTIHYQGALNSEAVAKVSDLLKSAPKPVKNLAINSSGGDVNAGMDLGEIVLTGRLDIVVKGLCASSCANYVFPAGGNKRIDSGSVVIWHGSAIQEGLSAGPTIDDIILPDGMRISLAEKLTLLESNRKQTTRYFEDAIIRQEIFFNRIGVDDRITVIGQHLKAAQEWTFSTIDMKRFGINNVVADENYGKCIDSVSNDETDTECLPTGVRGRGLKLLSLDDYPDYSADLKAQPLK